MGGNDRLFPDSQGDVLWVSGAGGSREFRVGTDNTLLSPLNDFATLVKYPDVRSTYTAKDRTLENFDSQGRETSVVEPDG